MQDEIRHGRHVFLYDIECCDYIISCIIIDVIGFFLDLETCQKGDTCRDPNAKCTYIYGRYGCRCNPGYTYNSRDKKCGGKTVTVYRCQKYDPLDMGIVMFYATSSLYVTTKIFFFGNQVI